MTTLRQFHLELCTEHLQEASFLYSQRLAYLHDPEISWPDVRDLEERFEAHIDALVVSGDLALEVCRRDPPDAGELHASLCVFCRQHRHDDVLAALDTLDDEDREAVIAAAQALRCEAPAAWFDTFVRLVEDNPKLTAIMAQIVGFRRWIKAEEQLVAALHRGPSVGAGDLAWALGRIGSTRSIPLLWSLLDDQDQGVVESAATALLRLGDERVVTRAYEVAPANPWTRRILGIGGDQRSVRLLLHLLEQSADKDTIIALGLLGDLSAVAPLLHLVEDEQVGSAAAIALNTITGAQLYREEFVPEALPAEESVEEEREPPESPEIVEPSERAVLGTWNRMPVRDRGVWQGWLLDHQHRFSRAIRWRMGRPHSPSALLACLACETSPFEIRQATYDEFVARYGLTVPFEPELRVVQQQRFLAQISKWVQAHATHFEEGRWYLAMQRQS